MLDTEVTAHAASLVVAQMLFLESENPDKPINFYINSPGGSVTAGMSIYDTMQFIKCPIHTIVLGQAASMGSLLATAGAKGHRYILPNARHMIHQPLGGASGQATDVEIQARELLRWKMVLTNIYVTHTGKSYSELERDMERDNFMTAQEAVEYGLADELISKRES
jgi:ATP-dependent Clp protease protease subunit